MTKDLVRGPDTTVALRFTAAEMDTVYGAFIALGVFDLREPHPDFGQPQGVVTTASGNTDHFFQVRGRGLTRHFAWTDNERGDLRTSPELERFFKAMKVVQRIVSRRPECARLPGPRAIRL